MGNVTLLIILFAAIILAVIILIAVIASTSRSSRTRQSANITTAATYKYKYKLKPSLTTDNELGFYKELVPVAKSAGLLTFSKVRLADLIEPVRGGQSWQSAFNHISQKHIDFVLCDKSTLQPMLAVELDDSSHDRPDRTKRDNDVNNALHSAGLPILHTRDASDLGSKVTELIQPKEKARA